MSLASLIKHKGSRVMGVDASTNTIAYAIIDNGKLVRYGDIEFEGSDIYKRILDAKKKIRALRSTFDVDYIALEAAVMVRSANTGLKMAYVFGSIMGELLENGAEVIEVHPLKWQGFIGNPNLTNGEKISIRKEFPAKSDNWYRAKGREIRKERTLAWVKKQFKVSLDSDNVGDAIGIAWYAYETL